MLKKIINILFLVSMSLHASECPQLEPFYQSVDCLTDQELEAIKACSKTYNNLVVTNALRTSNLNVTSATQLTGATTVNGSLSVTGQLTVNGLPVAGGLANYASFTNIDPVDAEETNTNVPWSTDSGSTTLSNPNNTGFIITQTGTGVITIQNPGTYLYHYGVSLVGNGTDAQDQTATAQLMLNNMPISPAGVSSFTIPTNSTASIPTPYELTSSGLFQTTMANTPLALSMNFTPSWTMPTAAGGGANAYITLIQVN